jgi:Zn-dependent protease with chaperone function
VVVVGATQTGLAITKSDSGEVTVWNYADLRKLPDQAREGGLLLTSRNTPEARLNLFDAALVEQINHLCPDLQQKEVPKGSYYRIAKWSVGAVGSVLLIMFVIIPAMANTMARLIPLEREIALGQTVLGQIERFLGGSDENQLACSNPAGLRALDKMTARLTGGFDTPYEYNIQVFDHKMINAFAVPGGQIVLMDGLIQAASSPEEVAGVLGHEMGHVDNRDSTRAILRTAGTAGILGMVLGDFSGGAAILLASEQVINASYAQTAETNADVFAHERFAEAKLPSARLADFFLGLIDEDAGDEQSILSHLASHPDLGGRADAAVAADIIGEGAFDPVLTDSEWQDFRNICSG